jgi:Ala-tRNA(Pro) deacylase
MKRTVCSASRATPQGTERAMDKIGRCFMAIPDKIQSYLEENVVSYRHKIHPVAYTSQEIAAADHIPGRELAKTVVLKADGRLVMAVLPADHVINMEALKKGIGSKRIALASEREFIRHFPSCQGGAMPPFGKLFGLPMYCDRSLSGQLEIEFNAGTYTDTIRMSFSEFERLEAPDILDFSQKWPGTRRARAA